MKPAAGGEIHWELSLDLEGMGSLGGLEYLTQLQLSADFAAGAEPDLAPLSGLTALTTLRLHLPYGISVSETAGGADAAAGPVLHGRSRATDRSDILPFSLRIWYTSYRST